MKTITKKVYGIDLDGVCFCFKGSFIKWLNGRLNIDLKEEEITSYYWHETTGVSKENFDIEFDRFGIEGHGYRNLELLDGAIEGLKRIHEEGHKIVYITSRPLYALEDTIASLEEHNFPQRENLYFSKDSKVSLVKRLNVDVFIDDSPTTVVELTTNTRAQIYCRNYSYNEHLDSNGDQWFRRVDNWAQFLKREGI